MSLPVLPLIPLLSTFSLLQFIKLLGLRNGFRHVLRRSHKDDKGEYKHGTYVCEYHAPPSEVNIAGDKPARASSRSIRLNCPYKINFARQGDKVPGIFHVNKRVMSHSHIIEPPGSMGSMGLGMGLGMGMGAMHPSMGMSGMGHMGSMGMGHMLAAQGMGMPGLGGMPSFPGQAAGAAGAAAAAAAAAAGGPGAQSAMSMFNLAAMGAMGMGVPGAAGSPSAVPGSASTQRQTPLTALLRLESAADTETPITEMPNAISNGCDQLKSQRTLYQKSLARVGGSSLRMKR